MEGAAERHVRPRRAIDDTTDELGAEDKIPEDLHEEFLLRLPPEQPKLLFRFATVRKAWRGIVTNPIFLRRYRDYHAAKPLMLGYLYNERCAPTAGFVSTIPAPFTPRLPDEGRGFYVIDSRHGRVLFHKLGGPCTPESILIWDPLSGNHNDVRLPDEFESTGGGRWSAAVLCDADVPCKHATCHEGPFRVLFVGMTGEGDTSAFVYRSRTSAEKPPTAAADFIDRKAATVVGNNVFFRTSDRSVVRFQFRGEGAELSFLELPASMAQGTVLVPAAGGRILRSAVVTFQSRYVRFCDTEGGADGPAEWTLLSSVRHL